MIVTGLRFALESTLSTATLGLLATVVIWWRTGDFNLVIFPAPLLEQLVIYAATFGGLFALLWLVARQHIELHPETRQLRVSSINTGFRWRTWHAKDIVRVGYYNSSKSLGEIVLSGASGTRPLAILEASLFVTEPSRHFREIAAFIRTHNPDVKIADALNNSSAHPSDPS